MSARVQFEAELNEMKDELVAMCRLTADMIANATTALVNFDRELGRSIGESDKKVDEYEMDIEKRCMRILIRRQPVARDFRVVSTALKMITDIERFGDQASDIGDLVYTMPGDTYIKKLTHLSAMGELAVRMVRESVNSFIRNDEQLADEVIALTDENAACHRRCRRFLEASALLREDILRLTLGCTDTAKIKRAASRIASREFGRPTGRIGEESHRMISAVTPDGITFFGEAVRQLCERIYIIEDDNIASSAALLSLLRGYALSGGHDIITSPSPLSPDGEPEHLLIPDLSLGFVTSNRLHPAEFDGAVKINSSRFTDRTALRRHMSRLNFTKKAYGEFIGEAVNSLASAKSIHDDLESIYISAMDFSHMDELAKSIAEDMLKRKI